MECYCCMIPWPTDRPPIRNDSKLLSVVLLSMRGSDQIQTQVPKDNDLLHLFGRKILPGIFMGYGPAYGRWMDR